MHNYMSFYIKPKTEHARGAEPNYLYSHFSAVFPAESLTIGRAELFDSVSLYMYVHVWAFSLSQYVHVYCVRNAYM